MATPHPTSLTLGHLPLKGKAFRNLKGAEQHSNMRQKYIL